MRSGGWHTHISRGKAATTKHNTIQYRQSEREEWTIEADTRNGNPAWLTQTGNRAQDTIMMTPRKDDKIYIWTKAY